MAGTQWVWIVVAVAALNAAAIVSWAYSVVSWRHHAIGSRCFSLLMASVGLWCLLYSLEIVLPGLAAKVVSAKMQYVAIVSVPVLWLSFSLRYTGQERWVTGPRVLLYAIIPMLSLGLVASTELHGLMWSSIASSPGGSLRGIQVGHGFFFWIHSAYSYALVVIGAAVLVRAVIRLPRVYRAQAHLMVLGAVVPLVANLVYLSGAIPADWIDITPFGFVLSGVLLALAMSRFRLFDLSLGLRTRARSALIEAMSDGVVVLDEEDRVVDVNPAAVSILRSRFTPLLGAYLGEFLRDHAGTPEPDGDRGPAHGEFVTDREDGARVFDFVASPVGGAHRSRSGHLVVLRDITERRRAEEAVLESERRYHDLVNNARDIILTVDLRGRLMSVNPAVEVVTGYAQDEVLGLSLAEVAGIEFPGTAFHPLLDGERERREVVVRHKDGRNVALEASIRAVRRDGRVVGFECIARDMTENRAWEDALRFQALHDSVTSLPNRMRLRERLQELISSSQDPSPHFALFVLDLDRFKEVNDSMGHHCGDMLLELVAARMRRSLRSADLLARLGGDEFALVVPVADADDACRVALRILRVFKASFDVEGQRIGLSGSVGIALYPDHGLTVESLLRFGDIAMYTAKKAGGGRYALYESEGDLHTPGHLELQSDLRSAFERGEFTLYYQPQIRLDNERVVGVEALVRWNHPRRGLVVAGQFVDLLEREGLSNRLTTWVLGRALAQSASWLASGIRVRMSINLSARDLDDPDLPRRIGELVRRHGVDPSLLTVELTETSTMLDPERSIEVLAAIRGHGVSVAIDDFGVGHSALSYVKSLPVDEVKIDKSFVLAMAIDKQDAAIVRATIGLAHELGLRVVAEGIEDVATKALLAAYGCDIGQGYLLGRPGPKASISKHLRLARETSLPRR
ncbi:MAG: EAL domain-containing protein [Thermoleophilia bacterium]|nr:EAL domain-containing protein [Thermoleophilia bacterium]